MLCNIDLLSTLKFKVIKQFNHTPWSTYRAWRHKPNEIQIIMTTMMITMTTSLDRSIVFRSSSDRRSIIRSSFDRSAVVRSSFDRRPIVFRSSFSRLSIVVRSSFSRRKLLALLAWWLLCPPSCPTPHSWAPRLHPPNCHTHPQKMLVLLERSSTSLFVSTFLFVPTFARKLCSFEYMQPFPGIPFTPRPPKS